MLTGQGKGIRLFEEAAEALRKDKFRKGDVIELPSQGDLILTGDIHGNLDNYEEIVARAALDRNPQRHLVIHELIHDFCNRGKDFSYEILQEACELKLEYPDQVHIVMGNHELAEYEEMPIKKDGRVIPLVFSESRMKALGSIGAEIKAAAKKFLISLPVAVRTQSNVWFSHSTPARTMNKFTLQLLERATGASTMSSKADALIKAEVIKDMVWGRDHSPVAAAAFCQKVGCEVLVVGHEFAADGLLVPNTRHIILDSTRENACILYLKLDKRYTHRQLVAQVDYLKPGDAFPPAKIKALKQAALQRLYPGQPA